MCRQVPKLAQVSLKTITPLHIGAGSGEAKPLEDHCLGGRRVPREYQPKPGPGGVVKLYRGWRDSGTPYIPGSTLRGCLRSLYTGALEAGRVRHPEDRSDEIFGSTDQAGAITLNDLLPESSVHVLETHLFRYLKATNVAGRSAGRSPSDFPVELVDKDVTFIGELSYLEDTLPQVLSAIFNQSKTLTDWLRTGYGGPNPETIIPNSPINNKLFSARGNQWAILWKLGRYAKSYAKALSPNRRLEGGAPHAYYLVQGTHEVPGWVRITFDLTPSEAEFRLNEWPRKEIK